MAQQMSDDELVRQVLAGRPEAQAELVARYGRYAYRLCRRMLGDHHEAEDASQEAFVRAIGGLDGFRGEAPLRQWLARVVVNVCLNWRRAAGRRRSVPMGHADPPARDEPHRLELTELQEKVQQAIGQLPERQRMALILRVYEELSFDAIADLMGGTPEAARTNLSLARRRLRTVLAPILGEVKR